MVPGAEARGLVAPRMAEFVSDRRKERGMGDCLPRPVLTASRPSQTMAQMGPESMSKGGKLVSVDPFEDTQLYIHLMRPSKKGLPFRSASVRRQ